MMKYLVVLALVIFGGRYDICAQQAALGKSVSSLQLVDPNDHSKAIPFIGEKVVVLFYTDPDEKDVNDPLSEALKAKNYPKEKYAGVGIANCKDTWIPDAAIRMKARQKEKQFPGSIVLLDTKRIVSQAWGLGDCNNAGVVIIIGKDAKIKFIQVIKKQAESKAAIPSVIKVIDENI